MNNKKYLLFIAGWLCVGVWACNVNAQTKTVHRFEKIQLSETFYGEGAGIGDINNDGYPDVIAGPYWYAGPDFVEKQAYYEVVEHDPYKYSDNFFIETEDINGDGYVDILMVGFPGESAFWFENPRGASGYWEKHLIHPRVDNESPHFYDLDGVGKLELVFHTDGYLGYARRNQEDVKAPWDFVRIYEQQDWGKFTHGFGIGDINGDGLEDIIMAKGWWQNPGRDRLDQQWEYRPADFGPGGAQMYAYDVNGDGLNDVITTLNAHGWGMAWYEQKRHDGQITFQQHLIMGDKESDNRFGVRFAEAHAIDLVDMDQDGVKDLVTGKRFWAHGPDGYYFHNNAAVLYWFKLVQDSKDPHFVPYLIDYNSGVGVEVETGDLTGNGLMDIVVSNKRGTFVFLHYTEEVSQEVWEYLQPRPIDDPGSKASQRH